MEKELRGFDDNSTHLDIVSNDLSKQLVSFEEVVENALNKMEEDAQKTKDAKT